MQLSIPNRVAEFMVVFLTEASVKRLWICLRLGS